MQFVCVEGQKLNEVSNTLSAPKLLIKHACCQQISNVKLWFSYGNQSSSRIDSPVSYFRLYFHPYENSFALNQLMQSKFSTINNFIVPCELHLPYLFAHKPSDFSNKLNWEQVNSYSRVFSPKNLRVLNKIRNSMFIRL